MKHRTRKIISILIISVATVFLIVCLYIKCIYDVTFEMLLFNLVFSEGTSKSVILDGCKFCIPLAILLAGVLFIPILQNDDMRIYFTLYFKKINKKIGIPIINVRHYLIYSTIILLLFCSLGIHCIGLIDYLKLQLDSSEVFENYYVSPDDVKLTFPEKKQNLIYIYLESFESDFSQMLDNQSNTINAIPNLEKLAKNNVNFSNYEGFGGLFMTANTTWTIAGMVAQTSGVPLKIPINGNNYGEYDNFLTGVTTLGDILDKEGYSQTLLIGSEKEFAGRDKYHEQHGNYNILDRSWAVDTGKIDSTYFTWWGFEDSKLFEYAKEELTNLAKNDEPFNFTILTANTHFPDGYMESDCKGEFDYAYANSLACSDQYVYEFVKWIMNQPFYKKTTVIIVGDHTSWQPDITEHTTLERTVYDVILNSQAESTNEKNRFATTLDMFPTTLASLGVQIEGDRLGLGTNLFSDRMTLAEEIGIANLTTELSKNSKYYNSNFLGY